MKSFKFDADDRMLEVLRTMAREAAFPVNYYGAPTVNNGDRCLRSHRRIRELVSFPDLLAKAYFAKPLAAFGKIFVRRSVTRFGFLLVLYGVIGPIYTYFEPNYLNFYSSLSYS